MTRRIAAALARVLAPAAPGTDMHFHSGSHGPFVCENPRCTSPGLDVSAS